MELIIEQELIHKGKRRKQGVFTHETAGFHSGVDIVAFQRLENREAALSLCMSASPPESVTPPPDPPRERLDDILPLAYELGRGFAEKHDYIFSGLSAEVERHFLDYPCQATCVS